MKLLFSFSWLLLIAATSSVLIVAKKGKKTKHTKNQNSSNSVIPIIVPIIDNDNDSDNNLVPNIVPINNDNDNNNNNNNLGPLGVGGPNLNCDPMKRVYAIWDCEDGDCASDRWKDGCQACMCYNQGNDSWCDGTKNAYYDKYFEEHGENPFGDNNSSNRKCNTYFSAYGIPCGGDDHDWKCENGLECRHKCDSSSLYIGCFPISLKLNLDCDPMKGSSYEGCKEKDCASTNWEDGCAACMCFNQGNASWCDGTQSAYYDNYFEEHGKNPFGDSNRSNRKCNTNFSPKGAPCKYNWECEGGPDQAYCYFDGPDDYDYNFVPTYNLYCDSE